MSRGRRLGACGANPGAYLEAGRGSESSRRGWDGRARSRYRGLNYADPFGLKPCEDRVKDLKDRVKRIKRRVDDYIRSTNRGLNDQDHLDQLDGEIEGFNNDLDSYHRDGCDDDEDGFRKLKQQGTALERMQLPAPNLRYGPSRPLDIHIEPKPLKPIDILLLGTIIIGGIALSPLGI